MPPMTLKKRGPKGLRPLEFGPIPIPGGNIGDPNAKLGGNY